MKPGKNDVKVSILISGDELIELKRHAWMMTEAFGLDSRIDKYQGARPIGLYRWDLECLIDTVDIALNDGKEYPDKSAAEYISLRSLYNRLKDIYEKTYD